MRQRHALGDLEVDVVGVVEDGVVGLHQPAVVELARVHVEEQAVAAAEMTSNGMNRLISANWSANPRAGSARQAVTVLLISSIKATGSPSDVLTVKCAIVTAFWA